MGELGGCSYSLESLLGCSELELFLLYFVKYYLTDGVKFGRGLEMMRQRSLLLLFGELVGYASAAGRRSLLMFGGVYDRRFDTYGLLIFFFSPGIVLMIFAGDRVYFRYPMMKIHRTFYASGVHGFSTSLSWVSRRCRSGW